MLRCSLYLACLTGVFCLGGLGCGSSTGVKPVKVKGTVTLDGQPLPDATVQFIPTSKDEGKPANAVTDSRGNFDLTTFSTGDGALPGEYKVIVDYKEQAEDLNPGGGQPDLKKMFTTFQKKSVSGTKKARPKFVVPKKYSNPSKPFFQQRVPADGPVNLQMESK